MPLQTTNSSLQTYQIHGCLMSVAIGPISFKLCKTLTLFVCVLSRLSRVWLFVTPCAVARQAPLFMGLSRQEYWSGLPCPPPGDLPKPGIKPTSLMSALTGGFLTTSKYFRSICFQDACFYSLCRLRHKQHVCNQLQQSEPIRKTEPTVDLSGRR